ncbi:class I SAM-dependent methyltransferase [Natronorarus salvus]|uniref:class I SAM-dependent methyltransferase n=1 Tax=Natronorarus salvus TaxID=3117733 RepID=UPI002F261A37
MDREHPRTTKDSGPNHDQFGFELSVQSHIDRMGDGKLFRSETRAINKYFTQTHARTLDIGCGTGRVTKALEERGFDVIGVDISDEMVHAARSHHPEIPFLASDAAHLPFPDDHFDYVMFSFNGIDYLIPQSRRKQALSEIHRVLRPSGTFTFSSHNSLATVRKWSYLKDVYLRPKNRTRWFNPYKFRTSEIGELETYFTTPLRQRRELKNLDFELVDVVGSFSVPTWLIEMSPQYVAKPA